MKNWIKALWMGLRHLVRYRKLVGWWYLIVAGWALLVAYPVHQLLLSVVGHSVSAADLLAGFNYTLWNDFKNAYGNSVVPIFNQSIFVLGLSLLSLIFATGGTVATFLKQPPHYTSALFWRQSAAFFWRLLRLAVLFLVVHGIALGLFGGIFYSLSNGWAPFTLENEGVLAFNFKLVAPFYGIALGFIFVWHDLSKLLLVRDDLRWSLRAGWNGLKTTLRHPFHVGSWMLIYGALWWGLWEANTALHHEFEEVHTTSALILMLASTQVVVLLRLTLKLLQLSVLRQLLSGLSPKIGSPSDSSGTP